MVLQQREEEHRMVKGQRRLRQNRGERLDVPFGARTPIKTGMD